MIVMDQRKRYQIFVSSTFADLEVERGKVMETILKYDCFPAGMELFPAMDEDIFEYIKRIIDDSDYYLLIIGGRYGSVDENGVSWTEREYDYAVSKHIPVLVFDYKDFTQLPVNKTDLDDKKRRKLIAFKKKAPNGKLIKYWTNADNLALAVATSLKSVLELQPRIGWVRANSVPSADSQKEIERLKKEITEHLEEIKRLNTVLRKKDADLKKQEADYDALDSSYQAAKQEIENHKKRIKFLEAEVEQLKSSQPESQPQTETFTVNGVSFKMVYVKGGPFMMGANGDDQEASDNEKPTHKVVLSDYCIGETQVTQALWQAVMGKNPSRFIGDLNCPVECVSWDDCQVFIERLNEMTGMRFHLPTEAQWEFAARGGNKSKSFKYAGGDDINDVAWYSNNSSVNDNRRTHPVGKLKPNELGLYDMSGNVWEWCQDQYDSSYYSISPTNDPIGPASGSGHVLRGGHWNSSEKDCRVLVRNFPPTFTSGGLGLRLAL